MRYDSELGAVLAALADPVRRSMVQRLAAGPATASQLGTPYQISQPAASRHLRVLRRAGLVRTTSSGRNVWYELAGPALLDVQEWLSWLCARWEQTPTLEIRGRSAGTVETTTTKATG